MSFADVDLNDSANLSFYSQMLVFKNDALRSELLFYNLGNAQQRTLHTLADGLDLIYEYSLATRNVRITRASDSQADHAMFVGEPLTNDIQPLHNSNDQISLDWFNFSYGSAENLENSFDSASHFQINDLARHNYDVLPKTPAVDQVSPASFASTSQNLSLDHLSNPVIDPQSNGASLRVVETNRPSQIDHGPSDQHLQPQFKQVPRDLPRKILNEDDRRRLCQYYVENPTTKQTEIAAVFGVERCTVSKVLRNKDKYLPPDLEVERELQGRRTQVTISKADISPWNIALPEYGNDNAIYYEPQIPPRAGSISSAGSNGSNASSGRRGALSDAARASMRAIKAVGGSCWRCKILRKRCNDKTPCTICPLPSPAPSSRIWQMVGCRRGGMKENTVQPKLCATSVIWIVDSLSTEKIVKRLTQDLNQKGEARLQDRVNVDMEHYLKGLDFDFIASSICFGIAQELAENNFSQPATAPLLQCVSDIIWELTSNLSSQVVFQAKDINDMVSILYHAAIYQGNLEKDQLIAQALICLRLGLEALNIMSSDYDLVLLHSHCHTRPKCMVDCITNFESALDIYMDELSRVFFDKQTMRTKLWWLSMFYSLYIQSVVRKIIIVLEGQVHKAQSLEHDPKAHNYLHIAIRLFIASAGGFDPLKQDSNGQSHSNSTNREQIPSTRDYQNARVAFKWNEAETPATYLKRIFGDDESLLPVVSRSWPKTDPYKQIFERMEKRSKKDT